jgi:hypothetical protein
MSIITIKYTMYGTKHATKIQTVGVAPSGRWPSLITIDRALVEFLVYRLKGQYLPLNLELCEDDDTLVLDIIKPDQLIADKHKLLYQGGRDLRLLNEWAYASSLMERATICTVRLQDGTKFNIHRNRSGKNLNKEVIGRVAFALQSIRPEWTEWDLKNDNRYQNAYIVVSNQPSYLYMANRDISHTTPAVYKILGVNNTERMFLERANARIDLGLDPYPFGPYDNSLDYTLFKSFGLDDNDIQRLKNVFNKGHNIGKDKIFISDTQISYGKIKILRTFKINTLLSTKFILPSDVLSMMGRYLSLNKDSNAQYTMTAKPYADILHDRWDVRYEGFSGPFNNRHETFSSMFLDTDFIFGSVGPFSADNIVRYSDHNASVNPPFTPYFHKLVKDTIIDAFGGGKCRSDMLVFVKVPKWNEEKSVDWLMGENNPYLVSHRVIPNGEYFFERINGNNLFRVTGGLLFAVLSPIGTKHPTFGESDMDKLIEDFRLSTPPEVLESEQDSRLFVDKFLLVKMLREGKDVLNMVSAGEVITKMTKNELMSEILKANDIIKNEKDVINDISVNDLE